MLIQEECALLSSVELCELHAKYIFCRLSSTPNKFHNSKTKSHIYFKACTLASYFIFSLIEFFSENDPEAADGGVLQINCSAPAKKLILYKLPGAKYFFRTH